MKIESPEFNHKELIPKKFTCEGDDVSPSLKFFDIPPEAQTLALIVDDPDAPMGVFDHWIVWNIPAQTETLPENAKVQFQGKNGFSDTRYKGPCPPRGPSHRYFFKLFALDTSIDLPQGSSKDELEEAMEGHILANAELIGLFQR